MYHINRIKINDNWRFQFEDEAEESINLPHSWNTLDTMEPDLAAHYRRGVGRYERDIDLLATEGRRQFVHFGAAAMRAEVWLDDVALGTHVGGYSAFALALPAGESGLLKVAVDNCVDIDLVPSDRSDFFLYGGLTRNVWLYETGPVRIEDLHFVQTFKGSVVAIRAKGKIDGRFQATTLQLTITDPNGRIVSQTEHTITTEQFTIDLPSIEQPQLWSPDEPNLYNVNGRLLVDGELSDEVVERIGFRFYDFPEGGPFYLNGERLLLRGTHRHEDWAGLGSAVPDALSWQEMEQIKEAGFNFIRLGHYPQAEAVLDACDQLGLIVWEEIPWCRGGVGGDIFKSQTRQMLKEMISEHVNRPSIIFWGMGNELDWESDHVDTTDDDVFAFLQELHDYSHELDPSRLTALRRYDRGAQIVDVYSPSIWSGWYRGRYEDYEAVLRDAMARFPRMIHTEWGGDSHVGRHNSGPHLSRAIEHHTTHEENPGVALSGEGEARASLDSDWSESYMLDLMEWHVQVQNQLPNLAGTAQWVFKDFGTPLRPENPLPYVNQKGLVARDGTPKDVYYLFKALQTGTAVCHIESPTWPIRTGEPGGMKRVRVYSNCERVELFVNGRSQGTKFPNPTISPASGLIWFVPLQMGNNQIRAVAVAKNGDRLEQAIEQMLVPNGIRTAAKMQGWLETTSPIGDKVVRANIQLVTSDGIPVIKDEARVCFELEGSGTLLVNQGTPVGSRILETANGRASILILNHDVDTVLQVTADGLPPLQIRQ